jgi:DNA repair exonuclease SbcCD ATPase subunit
MKFQSVIIKNFMALSEAQVLLADRGLVLIQGENKDESSAISNGAGKSSIADAICWCLYGVTARGEEGDKIVNRFTKEGCVVEVNVQDEDYLYTIKRHRKHKTGKNTLKVFQHDLGGVETDLTKGTDKLTQAIVEQILGCSYEVFTGAVYAGQEKMPDLPGMTDKNLKMLIEEASGATLLEAAYAEAQTRLRTKKSEVDTLFAAVEREKNAVAVALEKLADAEAGQTKFDADRLSMIRSVHTSAKTDKAALDELNAKIAAGEQSADLLEQIRTVDAAIASVAAERAVEKELIEKLAAAQRIQAINKSNLLASEEALKRAEKALADLAHQVGCPCRTCARPYSAADIEPAKKLAAAEIETAKREIATRKSELSKCNSLAKIAADTLEKHRASMTDVSASNAQRIEIDARLRAVNALEAEAVRLSGRIKNAVEQIKAIQASPNPFVSRIDAAKIALTHSKGTLVAAEANAAAGTEALRIAETVAKVFSPAGVRAFLLDEVTPFLNDQTAKYLGTLSDGHITATWTTLVKTAKGELREKFSIEVVNATGGDSFGLISGGEKRKVRIACALALQDLVARRATKPIELFIGDEIDDALDAAGIERLTTILEEKARERGSVFIISHSDLKDWVRNTITVTKKDELATIVEAVS